MKATVREQKEDFGYKKNCNNGHGNQAARDDVSTNDKVCYCNCF